MAQKLQSVVTISIDRCKGCGLCAHSCPHDLLSIDTRQLNSMGYHPACLLDNGRCTGCTDCAQMCPDCAITIEMTSSRRMYAEGLGKGQ